MFWETAGAVLFVFATLPIWLLVAWVWGVLVFLFSALVALIGVAESLGTDDFDSTELLGALAMPFVHAATAAWAIPTAVWDWAKYDHPWWALGVSLIMLPLWSSGESRR